MAAKRFGALDLTTINTDVVLMTGCAGWDSTVNIRFTNRTSGPVKVRMALVPFPSGTAVANLDDADYLEYDVEILANCVLENTGLALQGDNSFVVRTDTAGVSVVAYGWEEQLV